MFRTEKRRNPRTGQPYPWLVRSTAMVNHYYFYCVDRDFGPFFLKFSAYFPYTAKLCLNGHEYVKRQLAQRGIPYEAWTMASCPAPTPPVSRRSVTASRPRRPTPCCGSGCGACPTPFPSGPARERAKLTS